MLGELHSSARPIVELDGYSSGTLIRLTSALPGTPGHWQCHRTMTSPANHGPPIRELPPSASGTHTKIRSPKPFSRAKGKKTSTTKHVRPTSRPPQTPPRPTKNPRHGDPHQRFPRLPAEHDQDAHPRRAPRPRPLDLGDPAADRRAPVILVRRDLRRRRQQGLQGPRLQPLHVGEVGHVEQGHGVLYGGKHGRHLGCRREVYG